MIIEIRIPDPGESITEVEIVSWLVEEGSYVEKDQEIAEVESEKATLPLIAQESGKIHITAPLNEMIKVGEVACTIDTEAKAPKKTKSKETNEATSPALLKDAPKTVVKEDKITKEKSKSTEYNKVKITPVAKKLMDDHGLSLEDVINGIKRIGKEEVEAAIQSKAQVTASFFVKEPGRKEKREKISNLRKKLSDRLVAVKNETAMLTTFNEADMSEVIRLRKKYQDKFIDRHGVKLGFMSFFTKAITEALKLYPKVNSYIDGEEVVSPSYYDIAIAVQTDKGLTVPVIRNTEGLSLAEIEKKIIELADKARKNRLTIEEMTGGTFTITNGGVFGSLLSTPILNPPQSAILGMHNIVERPVAVEGNVAIRPMMYIALSYDHRTVDGRESVGFLVKVKEFIESPESMLLGGADPESLLLDL